VSGYLTWTHFARVQSLSCPGGGGVINCEAVTTSAESYFPPGTGWVPLPILGLLFLAMTALSLPMAWRTHDRRIHLVRLGLAGLGMVFALYLISVELVIVNKICIWCTTVHVITFFLFVLVMSTTRCSSVLTRSLALAAPVAGVDAPKHPGVEPQAGRQR